MQNNSKKSIGGYKRYNVLIFIYFHITFLHIPYTQVIPEIHKIYPVLGIV